MRLDPWETDVGELRRWAQDPARWSGVRPAVVVVALDGEQPSDEGGHEPSTNEGSGLPIGLPAVVVGVASDDGVRSRWCDLVVGKGDGRLVDAAAERVSRCPVASGVLVSLLRSDSFRNVSSGLLAESASYSVLQSGDEFRRWRDSRPRRATPEADEPVIARRIGDELQLTLNRPTRRNALDTSMRDALAELLGLAALDRSIRSVVLDGSGPSFCSGGDLDEFGTAPDPAVAHLVRLERSIGWLLHRVADRLTVHLHGAAVGSGIEMAAFASRVVATDDVAIALPEVSMGLIPGAGGTVSLARRIGRHRLCRLALCGERVGLRSALEWGLVDEELARPQ